MDVKTHIVQWIEHLSTKNIRIGGFSLCPYAKGAKYEVIETDGSDIDPPPWFVDLIIYSLPDRWTQEELFNLAKEYNKKYPELIFLPDHKDRCTEINGLRTNNGKFNLVLCQYRNNLIEAREKLNKTDYYQYWSENYLEEILNT